MTAPDALAVYLDASALTKLVVEEPESAALVAFVGGRIPMSSDLALVEVPRAVRAVAARSAEPLPLRAMMERVDELFGEVGFITADVAVLADAAMLDPPALRTLDAVHIAAARSVGFGDFVTYDRRQADAAQEAGLRTASPGA